MTLSTEAPAPTPTLQASFREVMASVCTPVSVVTSMAGDLPHGTTVSAFASLSMEPPMVLVSLDRSSELLSVVRASRSFGLNVLSSAQSALAMTFASKGGSAKFASVPWALEAGVPRLTGVGSFLSCRVSELVVGGDHVVLLGEVVAADSEVQQPLTYHGRVFGTHVAVDA